MCSNSDLFLSDIILCHEIEKLFHLVIYFFYLAYLLCFLIVESNCADTTIEEVRHLRNETILFLNEEEGFVLEPVDDTGQNLTGFLLNVCVN